MPDITKYKSVAVSLDTWKKLKKLEKKTHRSPSKQISFLVEVASAVPSEKELLQEQLLEGQWLGEKK